MGLSQELMRAKLGQLPSSSSLRQKYLEDSSIGVIRPIERNTHSHDFTTDGICSCGLEWHKPIIRSSQHGSILDRDLISRCQARYVRELTTKSIGAEKAYDKPTNR